MFMKENKKANFEKPATVIGEDIIIEGKLLRANNSIRINGKYTGDIEVNGSIVIGNTGDIQGNIKAVFIYVAGTVEGNIDVEKLAQLSSEGVVRGDITCGTLVIDEGGAFEGNCKMKPSTKNTTDKKEVKK